MSPRSLRPSFALTWLALTTLAYMSTASLFAQADPRADVFPLAIGNRWTYFTSTFDWDNSSQTHTDTGTTIVEVSSAIVGTDSTIWEMIEIRHLRSCRNALGEPETCVMLDDTSTYVVIENRHSFHRISRPGVSWALWRSPFPWTTDLADSVAVNRLTAVDVNGDVTLEVHEMIDNYPRVFTFRFRRDVGPVEITCSTTEIAGWINEAHHELRTSVVTDVDAISAQPIPSALALEQNYPNPFNPSTSISFSLPRGTPVRLRVFDLLGREIATIADATFGPGSHVATWNASACASGVYLLRLEAAGSVRTRLVSLLR